MNYSVDWDGPGERDKEQSGVIDRQELIAKIAAMIVAGETAEVIVDEVIGSLTPEDGYECPVCGICP